MYLCRFSRHRRKENALTRGDPDISRKADRQEVSRGHSSYRQRAKPKKQTGNLEVSQGNEGLNIKLFQIQ